MQFNDAAHDGQSQPGALALTNAEEALEQALA